MTISDLAVIRFTVPRVVFHNGVVSQADTTQTLTRISTDAGVAGYYFGGGGHGDQSGMDCATRELVSHRLKGLLVGQDPFDRERFWHWMWTLNLPEPAISVIDNALWDLAGRALGMPVYKLLGGCRDRVKAYASTYPNMGTPEEYAAHALACREQGYTHYKIHPYYFWDPLTGQAQPGGRPSHVAQDLEACRLVRAAVGPEMVLSFDPWGTYRTLEEALRVGRELQRLDFYWYEQPMLEYRVAAYERLTRELEIPILAPEIVAGSVYSRADWIRRGACDMVRIDVLRGGVTGARKTAMVAEAFGFKCEIHMAGFGNLQVLGSTSEDTCEYYERGLLAPGIDYDAPEPYLERNCDPLDADGCVPVPDAPGLGYLINWDYIDAHRLEDSC